MSPACSLTPPWVKAQTWATVKPSVCTQRPWCQSCQPVGVTMLSAPFLSSPTQPRAEWKLCMDSFVPWAEGVHHVRVAYDLTLQYLLIIRAQVLYSHLLQPGSYEITSHWVTELHKQSPGILPCCPAPSADTGTYPETSSWHSVAVEECCYDHGQSAKRLWK